MGFKEFRFQGQIVETCLSCTSHNPKQECTSELVGPAICLQHWTKKIKSKNKTNKTVYLCFERLELKQLLLLAAGKMLTYDFKERVTF